MSTTWLTLNNTLYAPQWTANGYLGLSGSQLQQTGLADNWQFGGTFTKILGKHTIKAGGDFQSNNFRSPIAYSNERLCGPQQTAGLGAQQGVGGNAWASLLLGVPREASYRNIREVCQWRLDRWGIRSGSVQSDEPSYRQCRLPQRPRVDADLRIPRGTAPGTIYTGNANPITGQYELNALPPNCSATQGAPCIPTGIYTASSTPAPGGLPPHAYVNPASDHRVIKNSFGDWAGRLGLAYRLGDKTVIRGSYSRFYDAWATIGPALAEFRRQLAGGQHHRQQRLERQYSNGDGQRSAEPRRRRSAGLSHQRLQPGQPVDGRSELQDSVHGSVERRRRSGSCLRISFSTPTTSVPSAGTWTGVRHEHPAARDRAMSKPGGPTPTCCSNGSTRASATAATTPCRSPQQAHQPWRNLPGRLHPVAFRRRRAAGSVRTVTRRIRTTGAATTAPPTSTSRTRSRRHLRCSRHSPTLPTSASPILAGGWALNGIGQISSGLPYTVTDR